MIRPAALLAALLVSASAHADSPFILPSSTNLSGQAGIVTFDAAASDHVFFFDHRALQLATIKVTRPDGTAGTTSNGAQGRFRATFDVPLDQQGTWKVSSEQAMVTGSFKLNGEERRVGRFPGGGPGGPGGPGAGAPRPAAAAAPAAPAGPPPGGGAAPGGPRRLPPVPVEEIPAEATDVHVFEVVRSTATYVTLGAPSEGAVKPVGKGLEFDPVTHPNALAAGETAKFRYLIDGKPAPGVKLTLIPGGDRYRDDAGVTELTTGADGTVSIQFPTAGVYWLDAAAEDKHPSEPKAEARRMSTAVTLEVATP